MTLILPKKPTTEAPFEMNDGETPSASTVATVAKTDPTIADLMPSPVTQRNVPTFGSNPNSGFGMYSAQPQTQQGSISAMQEGGSTSLAVDHSFSTFINQRWRPLMAVVYMITVSCDFVIFPILWSVLQAFHQGQVHAQWQPLTLQGAGLYHIAMGAVLGLAAYGRSQEKIAGKA